MVLMRRLVLVCLVLVLLLLLMLVWMLKGKRWRSTTVAARLR